LFITHKARCEKEQVLHAAKEKSELKTAPEGGDAEIWTLCAFQVLQKA